MITRPDKGTGVVLWDRIEYINKMNVTLNDQAKFQKISQQKDCIERIERQLTGSIKLLKENDLITSDRFEDIKPVGTHIPRLYDLPNVHKTGIPLRPELDMSGYPYRRLPTSWL